MGKIPRSYGWLLDVPGKVSGGAACGSGSELEVYDGEVHPQYDWTGGKGGLWDR